MKKLFLLLTIIIIAFSCGSKKGYLDRNDSDKSLQEAVKKIKKNPSDEKAIEAIPELYIIIKKKHLDKINAYRRVQQINRWGTIINEYEYLQDAYDAIINSPAAFKLVNPESYNTNLLESKDSAAAAYYSYAQTYLNLPGRENAITAYGYFKTAGKFSPGYKDINEKMQTAYENSFVNLVINPVQDNSYFNKSGWGNFGNNYSNEYFQTNLLRDLSNNNRLAARFYSQWDAKRMNINPDWVVGLLLKNITIPSPENNYSERRVSKQLQIGTDTAGLPVYHTVYATINTTRSSFTAKLEMEIGINEVVTNKNISFRSLNCKYSWLQENATFSGDKRAISSTDWNIINNSDNSIPRKEAVLNELYKEIYPKVLDVVTQAVKW